MRFGDIRDVSVADAGDPIADRDGKARIESLILWRGELFAKYRR